MVKMDVAYIKGLMDEHKMTLGQLEIKSGISKSHLSRILSGKRGVGMKTIKGIMKAFPEAKIDKIFLDKVLPNGSDV